MAAPHLQLDPHQCSEIGRLVLDYIESHQLTFTDMAEQVGISRAALRLVCLKEGNPGKRTIPKLAQVLDKLEQKLCRMVFHNKFKLIYQEEDEVNLAMEAIDALVKVFYRRLEDYPLGQKKPIDYDIYEHAMKAVVSLPGNKKGQRRSTRV